MDGEIVRMGVVCREIARRQVIPVRIQRSHPFSRSISSAIFLTFIVSSSFSQDGNQIIILPQFSNCLAQGLSH